MAEFVYSYAPLTLPSTPRGERLKSIRCLPPVDPLTVCTRVHILAAMKKEYDFSKGRRGAVLEAPPGKTRITIRIDDDILRWFRTQVDRAGGGSYQTAMNEALRRGCRPGPPSLASRGGRGGRWRGVACPRR